MGVEESGFLPNEVGTTQPLREDEGGEGSVPRKVDLTGKETRKRNYGISKKFRV